MSNLINIDCCIQERIIDIFVCICRKHTARIWLPKHSWNSTWSMGKKSQSLSQAASFLRTDHTLRSAILDSHGLASFQQKLSSLSSQESGCHTYLLCLTRSASCYGMTWCRMTLELLNCSSVRKARTSSKQNLVCKPFRVFASLTICNHFISFCHKIWVSFNLSYVKAALDHSDVKIVLFITFYSILSVYMVAY